jgi:SsrA-binding protein
VNATIEPYAQGNRENHEPLRDRKLLVRKIEIDRLASRVAEKGLTLVPLRIYFKDGRAKVEIALARGKEGRDKRDALAERDTRREIEREMKTRFRG